MPQAAPAKICRPRISGVLHRERLFAALDQARERPVVWIESPAGAGKTTLVSSYLDARGLKCLWYQMDEGDSDAATFFFYMSLAGKNANRRRRKPLPLLTHEYLAGVPTFAKRFFEDLCNRLPPPFVLVLDNYHEVADDSSLHDIIRHGLSVLPNGISAIVISRTAPPPAMAPLRVARSLSVIGWHQLRLQHREFTKFVGLNDMPGLKNDMLQRLYTKTDGWIAGLVLMLERLKSPEAEINAVSDRPPGELFEYFAVEIFNRLDDSTRDLLLKTAYLPSVSVQLARKITNIPHAEQILASLHRHHFFTDKRTGEETVYQYHPLFKEFLLDQAGKRFSAEEGRCLRLNAARACESAGLVEDAAELFQGAADWGELRQLAIKNAPALVAQGRSNTIKVWISALPAAIVESDPWLLFWMGQCLLFLNPGESRTYFEKAFQRFCERKDVPGIYHAWCGIVESIEYGFENLTPLGEWIAIFDDLTQKYGPPPEGDIEFRVASSFTTALVMFMPDHPRMDEWLAKARILSEKSPNIHVTALTLFHCSYYLSSLGEFVPAEAMVQSLKRLAAAPGAEPFVKIVAELAKALYCQHAGKYDACLKAVDDGMRLANFNGIHLLDFQLMGQAVMSSLGQGDLQKAEHYLTCMTKSVPGVPKWDRAFYHFLLTWKAFLAGDLATAATQVETAHTITLEVGAAPSNFLCNLEKALVLHATGHHQPAFACLASAYQCCRRFKGFFLEFTCRLTESWLLFQTGDATKGLAVLRDGLAIGRQHGYLSMYIWYPAMMSFLCAKALEAEIAVDYVQDLISYHDLMPPQQPLPLDNWPWPVKLTVLGNFAVEVDGAPLVFTGKTQKKPLEMLQAIIAFGGENVRDEQITEALWPDSDGDLAMQSYRTTLSRLRRLLRHENAIITGSGMVGLDRRFVWADLWALEQAVKAGDQPADEASGQPPNRLLIQLERYAGEFLPGCNEPWALPMRERIRNTCLHAIMLTGNRLEDMGATEEAIRYYRQGLEFDRLVEALYQRLITCYGKLGRGAEALRLFNSCRQTFADELGIEPSATTAAILKRHVALQG